MPINLKRILTQATLCLFIVQMFFSSVPLYAQASEEKVLVDKSESKIIDSEKVILEKPEMEVLKKEMNLKDPEVEMRLEQKVEDIELIKEKTPTDDPIIIESVNKEVQLEEVLVDSKLEEFSKESLLEKEEYINDEEINEEKEERILQYSILMRKVYKLRAGEFKDFATAKKELVEDLSKFIELEQEKIQKFNISNEKKNDYIELLNIQLERVKKQNSRYAEPDEYESEPEIKRPDKPTQFRFTEKDTKIKSINLSKDIRKKLSLLDQINPFKIETAYAVAQQYLPVLEDLQQDSEVKIDGDIIKLARELKHNPVSIFNYVYNNIEYEPYFGAKKGSSGCLKELVCNDTDAASLTIALMRASGIPARYQKGVALMPPEQVRNLVGVEEVRTAFIALNSAEVPIFITSGNPVGVDATTYDFSQEDYLGIEWTYPEIFYQYDERGGNFSNPIELLDSTTTQDLQDLYVNDFESQWIPVDAMAKSYTRTVNEIVHDTASFDTENFWYGFLQYQGVLSPLEKYIQDLQTQTGKDITNSQYQSIKELNTRTYDYLPSTTPYIFDEGTDSNGNPVNFETWSELPNSRKVSVTISVLRQSDNFQVLSQNFYASEINNKGLDIIYTGATPADQAVIESYGGIHLTPASLVNITPYFLTDIGKFDTTNSIPIGESMLLQFDYYVNGSLENSEQKLTVAGNNDGVYVVFSKIQDNPKYNDGIDDESEILLKGETGIAWKYIREIENDSEMLEKVLDHTANVRMSKTIVTQSRILNEVAGVPTTFEFKGLNMDSSSFVNNYSNRGNYLNHSEDFVLFYGINNSFYESEIFNSLTGVTSISTVTGLQYAYDNPGTYSVHVINSSNESVIDTLSLSANTKQNMHTDIQAGKTIVTPDQPVSMGSFMGTLYTSIDPEGTGLYAIGEQNGAFGVDDPVVNTYPDVAGTHNNETSVVQGTNLHGDPIEYVFEEGIEFNYNCYIPEDRKNNALAEMAPYSDYGYPCFVPETGNINYYDEIVSYIVATGATKFYRAGDFAYWEYNRDIVNDINNFVDTKGYNNDAKIEFSDAAGTWVKHVKHNISVYYTPYEMFGTTGDVFEVFWSFKKKLEASNYDTKAYYCDFADPNCARRTVDYLMGYPTSSVQYSGSGFAYQDFIGGRIYSEFQGYTPSDFSSLYNPWPGETYYVISQFIDHINSNGGFSEYGEVDSDPIYDPNNNTLCLVLQKQNVCLISGVSTDGQIEWVINDAHVTNHDQVYWEGFIDEITENGIFGVVIDISSGVAIERTYKFIKDKILKKAGTKFVVKFIPVAGWIFLAGAFLMSSGDVIHLTNACNAGISKDGAPAMYYCGKRDATLVLVGVGMIGDGVASSRLARNIFYTGKTVARNAKNKLFEVMNDDYQKYYLEMVSGNSQIFNNRVQFFENFDYMASQNDIASLKTLLDDPDYLFKLNIDAVSFYKRLVIKDAFYGDYANSLYPTHTNPPPFTPNRTALRLGVSSNLTDMDLIRVHNATNQLSPYLIRRADIPYKSDGSIDTQKICALFNIPGCNITQISRYLPNINDSLIEGSVNGGIDGDIKQYAIESFKLLSGPEQASRFARDTILETLLP